MKIEEAEENCSLLTTCDGGPAEYDRNYGRCLCPVNRIPDQIEGCCAIPQAELNSETGQLFIGEELVENVYGLDEAIFDVANTFAVQITSQGIFAELPLVDQTRRKRQANFVNTGDEYVQNPTICLLPGEMILFGIEIDERNRNESSYPKYLVSSLFNSNPSFDYGAFRTLERVILSSENINFDKFAYVFDQTGNFVFQNSRNSLDTVLIHVALEGTNCGNKFRIQPSSERSLSEAGVSQRTNINLTPNWPLIAGLMGVILAAIFILLLFSAYWTRKDRTLMPWKNWKPKYLAVDLPFTPPAFTSNKIKHNLEENVYSSNENTDPSCHISSKELYDRLEDQNLQIAMQMQQHQSQLQNYFKSMAKEADKLQKLIDKVKNPVEGNTEVKNITEQSEAQSREKEKQELLNASASAVGYASNARVLMKAVQQLLNNLNDGRVNITDEMIEATLKEIKADGAKNVDLNFAKRLDVERKLLENEQQTISELFDENQTQYEKDFQKLIAEENDLLNNCTSEADRDKIMKQYASMRSALKDKNKRNKEAQLNAIQVCTSIVYAA